MPFTAIDAIEPSTPPSKCDMGFHNGIQCCPSTRRFFFGMILHPAHKRRVSRWRGGENGISTLLWIWSSDVFISLHKGIFRRCTTHVWHEARSISLWLQTIHQLLPHYISGMINATGLNKPSQKYDSSAIGSGIIMPEGEKEKWKTATEEFGVQMPKTFTSHKSQLLSLCNSVSTY